jgi:hypothetical protein
MVEYWRDNLGLTAVDIVEEYGTDDWKDHIQVLRLSGGGPPDAARYLMQNISSDGYVCRDYIIGCSEDDEFSPQILELLKEADRMDRDDPAYCETVQEALWLWRDFYIQPDLAFGASPATFMKWWVKGWKPNFFTHWYTLPEMYVVEH